MAKTTVPAGKTRSDDQLASAIRDSAEQIWLAGLGAFAKAQEEGTKVFEALVREGDILQQRTRTVTEQRLEEVADRFAQAATQLSRQATQSWDRLEQVFEDRVARALSHLGVPSARDVRELTEMLQALNQRISALDIEPDAHPRGGAAKARAAAAVPSRTAVPGTAAAGSRRATKRRQAVAEDVGDVPASDLADGAAKASARAPAPAAGTTARRSRAKA
jgi:poly(hydroxyalkanoate) granule-associated protein